MIKAIAVILLLHFCLAYKLISVIILYINN